MEAGEDDFGQEEHEGHEIEEEGGRRQNFLDRINKINRIGRQANFNRKT